MMNISAWPMVFVAIFVALGWKSFYQNVSANSFIDMFLNTVVLAFLCIFPLFVGFGVALLAGAFVPKKWSKPKITKLVSLRGEEGSAGRFFLGTGSVKTSQCYFFYKKVGKGYQPCSMEVGDNVMVFEEDRTDGELRSYSYEFENPSLEWVAASLGKQRHEFYIPKGSLKKGFVLQ